MSDHESTSQFFGDKLKEEPDCPLCQELNCIGLHKECVFGPHGAPCSASIKCSESEDHIIAKNPLFPRLSGRAPSVTQICGRKAEDEEPRVVGQQDGKPTPSSESKWSNICRWNFELTSSSIAVCMIDSSCRNPHSLHGMQRPGYYQGLRSLRQGGRKVMPSLCPSRDAGGTNIRNQDPSRQAIIRLQLYGFRNQKSTRFT